MNSNQFNPGNPDHLIALNEQVEQLATPPVTWPLWIAILISAFIGIAGLTTTIVKGKPIVNNNVPVPTVTLPPEAIKVTATIDNAATTAAVEKVSNAIGVNTDKVSEAVATAGNGNKSAVAALEETLKKGLEGAKTGLANTEKALDKGNDPVQVTPPTTTVVNDAPSPTKFMEEQTLTREVSDAEVKWIKVGKYHLPVWKTNNRGVTSSSEPKLTKPKGLENARWVVINGSDWALLVP